MGKFLIIEGSFRITFKIGVFKKEYRHGEIHDRGTGFEIKEQDLEKIFEKVETFGLGH